MKKIYYEFLVLIGVYEVYYIEETVIERTGLGDYDYDYVETGKMIKEYRSKFIINKNKLPF